MPILFTRINKFLGISQSVLISIFSTESNNTFLN